MAARFWVGGTGTWDTTNTANWSATTGGASGASVPTATDTATFDDNSGTGICTTAAGATCSILTMNSSTLTLKLGANFSTSTGGLAFTKGSVDLNDFVLNVAQVSGSNSNTRSIAFGSAGQINLNATSGTLWTTSNSTGFTTTGTNKVVTAPNGGAGTRAFNFGSSLAETDTMTFKVTSGTDIVSLQGNSATVDFTGFAGTFSNNTRTIYGNLILSSGMTCSAGTFPNTFAATSGIQQITTNGVALDFPLTFNGVGGTFQLQDNCTVGSTRTVNLTAGTLDLNNNTLSCGLFSSSNSNTRTLEFGSSGVLSLTGNSANIFSISSSTGLTTSGSKTVNATYNGSTGTRTVNGSATISESNAINFNITAGSDSLSLQNNYLNLNLTGFSGTLTNNTRKVYYNFTIPSGVTCTDGALITTLAGTTGTSTITTNGVSLLFPITVDGVGGTFVFNDALTLGSDKEFTLTNGTVKLKAGATSTVGAFATSGSNQKYLQSTTAGSQATLSQASGTVTVSYLSIKDIAATGGATWNAYVDYNNVNQGDNTGWDFSNSPAIDNEFPIALRSFTQPKRF